MSDIDEIIDSGDVLGPEEENVNFPPVLVVEDEAAIFGLIEAFAEFISVRCRWAKTDAEIDEALSSGEISVVISDLRIPGVADPIATIHKHLRNRARAALLTVTGFTPLAERPSGLSPHIAHLSLGKPFRAEDLNPRLRALIAYVQGAISLEVAERAFPAEIERFPHQEEKLDLSCFEGSDLSSLMAALPVHPQNVQNAPSGLTRVLPFVVGGLQALRSAAQTASSEVFSTLRRALFPVNKRLTLLSIVEHVSPAAALVLDCAWHDVNNVCMAWENDPSEAAEHCREIETILNPAVDAFDQYLTTGDLCSFVSSQLVDFSHFKSQGEETLSVPDSPEGLSVLAPMGAMASLWRTFVTNAAKVADRHYLSEYLLGLTARIEDGVLHVFIYDDLPSFSEEQLRQLFDAQLSSDTAGMGTGLQRLADLMDLLNRDLSGSSPLISYHRDAGGVSWKVKSPKQSLRSLSAAEVAECVEPLQLPTGATKIFHLQFPIGE